MAARTLDELWADYKATEGRLEEARIEHDEAYKLSMDAYKRWIAAGGDPKATNGDTKDDT
jgi:hypothetical protein